MRKRKLLMVCLLGAALIGASIGTLLAANGPKADAAGGTGIPAGRPVPAAPYYYQWAVSAIGNPIGAPFQIPGDTVNWYKNYDNGYMADTDQNIFQTVETAGSGAVKYIGALRNMNTDGTETVVLSSAKTSELARIDANSAYTGAEKAAFETEFAALCGANIAPGFYYMDNAGWNGGDVISLLFGDTNTASLWGNPSAYLIYNLNLGQAFFLTDEFAAAHFNNDYNLKYGLGLPVGDGFAYGGVQYQNFTAGFAKVASGVFTGGYGLNIDPSTGSRTKLQSLIDAQTAAIQASGTAYSTAGLNAISAKYNALYDSGFSAGIIAYQPASGSWNSNNQNMIAFKCGEYAYSGNWWGDAAILYNATLDKAFFFCDDWFNTLIVSADYSATLGSPISDGPNTAGILNPDEETSLSVNNVALNFSDGVTMFEKGYVYRNSAGALKVVSNLSWDYTNQYYTVTAAAAPAEFGNYVGEVSYGGGYFYNYDNGCMAVGEAGIMPLYGVNADSSNGLTAITAVVAAQKAQIGTNAGAGFISDITTVTAFRTAYQRLYDLGIAAGLYFSGQDIHDWNGAPAAFYVYGDSAGINWATAAALLYNPNIDRAFRLSDQFLDGYWNNLFTGLGYPLSDSPNNFGIANPDEVTSFSVKGMAQNFANGVMMFERGYAYRDASNKLVVVGSLLWDPTSMDYIEFVSIPAEFGNPVANFVYNGSVYFNFDNGYAVKTGNNVHAYFGFNVDAAGTRGAPIQSALDAQTAKFGTWDAGSGVYGNASPEAAAMKAAYQRLYDAGYAVGFYMAGQDIHVWNGVVSMMLDYGDGDMSPYLAADWSAYFSTSLLAYNPDSDATYLMEGAFMNALWNNAISSLGSPLSDSPNAAGISTGALTSFKVNGTVQNYPNGAQKYDFGYLYLDSSSVLQTVGSLYYDSLNDNYLPGLDLTGKPAELGAFAAAALTNGTLYYNFEKGYAVQVNSSVKFYFGFNIDSSGARVELTAVIAAEKAKFGTWSGAPTDPPGFFIQDPIITAAFRAAYQRLYDTGYAVGCYIQGQDIHSWNGIVSMIFAYGDGANDKYAGTATLGYNPSANKAFLIDGAFYGALWDVKLTVLGAPIADSTNPAGIPNSGELTSFKINGAPKTFTKGVQSFQFGYAYVDDSNQLTIVDSLFYDAVNNNYIPGLNLAGLPAELGAFAASVIASGVLYYNYAKGYAVQPAGAASANFYFGFNINASGARVELQSVLDAEKAKFGTYNAGAGVYGNNSPEALAFKAAYQRLYDMGYAVGFYIAGQDIHPWVGLAAAMIFGYGDSTLAKYPNTTTMAYNPVIGNAYLVADEFYNANWDNVLQNLGNPVSDSPNKAGINNSSELKSLTVNGETVAFDYGVMAFDLGYAYRDVSGNVTAVGGLYYAWNGEYIQGTDLEAKPATFGGLLNSFAFGGQLYYNYALGYASAVNGVARFHEFMNVSVKDGALVIGAAVNAPGEFGTERNRYTIGGNVYINYEHGAIAAVWNAAGTAYDITYWSARSFDGFGAMSAIDNSQLPYFIGLIDSAFASSAGDSVLADFKQKVKDRYTALWNSGYVAGIIDGRGNAAWKAQYDTVFYFGDNGYRLGMDFRWFTVYIMYDSASGSLYYLNGVLLYHWQINITNYIDGYYDYGLPASNPVAEANGDIWQSFKGGTMGSQGGTLIYSNNAVIFMPGGTYQDFLALPKPDVPTSDAVGDTVTEAAPGGCKGGAAALLLVLGLAAAPIIRRKAK